MADWQAFATAFLRDTAGYINERKDKAEDYADKLREQADKNKLKLGKLRAAAKAQQGFISQARGLYASDAQIEAALDAGPTGLQNLVAQLSDLKAKHGKAYNENLVSDFAKLPEGFKATGNLDPMSRYGLTNTIVGDMAKPEGGFFSLNRMFGLDAKERVRGELDAEAVGDTGMSVYDLAQISDIAGYESLNPSSFLSYTAPKIMVQSSVADEILDLDKARNSAEITANKLYDARVDAINSQKWDSLEEKQDALKKAAADRDARVKAIVENYVNARRAEFDNYDKLMGSTLESMGITAALPAEINTNQSSTQVKPAGVDPNTKVVDYGKGGAGPEIMDQPAGLMAGEQTEGTEGYSGIGDIEKVAEARSGESARMHGETLKPNAMKEGLMAPELEQSVKPKTITYEEWKKMSKKQKEALGLPTSTYGIQQITRNGIIEVPSGEGEAAVEIDSVKKIAEEKYGLSQATAEELIDSGMATEMDIQLLAKHGDELLRAAEGVERDSMSVNRALVRWAEENKKQLPFNMNFLTRFVIDTLNASEG